EYMASMIGVKLGEYWQITTNLHLYAKHSEMLQNRAIKLGQPRPLFIVLKDLGNYESTTPLMKYPESFDNELEETIQMIADINCDVEVYDGNLTQPFLRDVVLPMAKAHRHYKNGAIAEAFAEMERVIAADWKKAGIEWLNRRTSMKYHGVENDQPT